MPACWASMSWSGSAPCQTLPKQAEGQPADFTMVVRLTLDGGKPVGVRISTPNPEGHAVRKADGRGATRRQSKPASPTARSAAPRSSGSRRTCGRRRLVTCAEILLLQCYCDRAILRRYAAQPTGESDEDGFFQYWLRDHRTCAAGFRSVRVQAGCRRRRSIARASCRRQSPDPHRNPRAGEQRAWPCMLPLLPRSAPPLV